MLSLFVLCELSCYSLSSILLYISYTAMYNIILLNIQSATIHKGNYPFDFFRRRDPDHFRFRGDQIF